MAQLSRPYQVVLALVAVLALAWFVVLRAHTSAGNSPSSASTTSASTKASPSPPKAGAIERDEGKPTAVYHGAAPGLQGLSKDIRRAHATVGASEVEAKNAEAGRAVADPAKAAQTAPSTAGTTTANAVRASTHHAAVHHTAVVHRAAKAWHASKAADRPGPPSRSRAAVVGAQLHQGKVVLLLFWNPRSSDDRSVHAEVEAASRSLKGKVAYDFAKASEVGSFGTVTRDVSVLQTPTLLIINHKGLVSTITGLTDAFSIEQAVREAAG
jgi:hypothetical protein